MPRPADRTAYPAAAPARPVVLRRAAFAGRRCSRGYAQAMFLVVMTLLTSLTLLVVAAANTDLQSSHRDVALSQARALAETGLEDYDSAVMSDPTTYLDPLLTDPTGGTIPYQAFHTWATWQPAAAGTDVNRSGGSTGGAVSPCTTNGKADYYRDCYYVDVRPAANTATVAGVSMTTQPLVTVTSVARVRCGGIQARCTYAALQQRLRKRQLFDYLFYTQYDALDPNLYPAAADGGMMSQTDAQRLCADKYASRAADEDVAQQPHVPGWTTSSRDASCVEVAYQSDPGVSGDTVRGPVFTNDDRIVVCGNPRFADPVTVAGNGAGAGAFWASAYTLHPSVDTGCAGSKPLNAAGGDAVGSYCATRCAMALPPANLSAQTFAAATDIRYQVSPAGSGPVSVQILPPAAQGQKSKLLLSNATAAGAPPTGAFTLDLPSNGLLDIAGDATLTGGLLAGQLYIHTSGNLTISGDVRYCAAQGGASVCDQTSTVSPAGPLGVVNPTTGKTRADTLNADTADLLVLVAGKAIVMSQPGAVGVNRELDALLIALQNAVYTDGWNIVQGWSSSAAASTPALHFFGAMAARYQGVFGSYGSVTGNLVSGYHKDFYFDTRLRDNKIAMRYYPLSPGSALWMRVDTSEVPGKSACAFVGTTCP